MRDEYQRKDLGEGIRGKYLKEFQKGTSLVLLSPDVAAAFPDDESVNDALRGLMKLARRSLRPGGRSAKSPPTARNSPG